MVSEGVDELCRECPLRTGECCASPQGNEDEVRKWDAILLKELGVSYGSCFTAEEWQKLIEKRMPFKLCRRCYWKQVCSVGATVVE